MSHDIITQVTQDSTGYRNQAQFQQDAEDDVDYASIINLNVRGEVFHITRDELMNLPESILLCLFPNGVFVDINGNQIQNITEEDVVYVNFDPVCFRYIVESFAKAAEQLPTDSTLESYDSYQTPDAEVLSEKPAIIVLREDLDYYVIPPHKGLSPQNIKAIKTAAGSYLVSRSNVFEGLGYGKGKTLGPAEEHLLEMLCSSGFQIDSDWGHRTTEPSKTVLTSLALVDLKNPEPPTPTPSPEDDDEPSQNLSPVTSNVSGKQPRKSRLATLASSAARSASRSVSRNRSQSRPNDKKKSAGTSSKLLLFWRKPARKCWWSDDVVTLKVPGIMGPTGLLETIDVSLHIRRVWTLELSVIGVH